MANKKQNTDAETEETAPNTASESHNSEKDAAEPQKNNLKKYGLKSKADLKPEVDVRNGKVIFTSDAIPDGSLLTVSVNGQIADVEFLDGVAIFARGGSFYNYPSIEIE